MRDIGLVLLLNLVALVCASAAAFLAYHDKSGWGWFLVVAALTAVTRFKS